LVLASRPLPNLGVELRYVVSAVALSSTTAMTSPAAVNPETLGIGGGRRRADGGVDCLQ